MNFVYEDGKIYFHGAKEGHKIDAIKNNPKVSMSIIDQEDVIEEVILPNPPKKRNKTSPVISVRG